MFGRSIHRRAAPALAILRTSLQSGLFLRLAALDACIVILHIFLGTRKLALVEHPINFFRLGKELGLPELLEHLLLGGAAVSCLVLAYRTKQISYLMLFVIVSYLLADNSLQLHENIGLIFNESDQKIGELAVNTFVGCVFLIIALIFYTSANSRTKAMLAATMLCFAWLAGFGIAIDFVNGGLAPHTMVKALSLLIEEAAELLGMSLLAVVLINEALKPSSTTGRNPIARLSRA